MLLKTKFLKTFILFISTMLLGVFSYAQDMEKEEPKVKVTQKGTKYELVGFQNNVVYNPNTFTWYAWKEPVVAATETERSTLVPVSQFDRPPVFHSECLKAEDKYACTQKHIGKYISNNLEYPNDAQENLQEGLEYVTLILDENGNYEGNLKVVSKSKDNTCKGCAEAAADIVSEMEDMWYPAILEGEPVKTEMTIPIRFELIDQ